MELTCFIAEWLKVNSPDRWDSLKTNLDFKHSFFSHHMAKRSQQNRKVVVVVFFSAGLMAHWEKVSNLLPGILRSY